MAARAGATTRAGWTVCIAEALRAQLTGRTTARAAPFRLITVKGGGLRPGVDLARRRTIEEAEDLERWQRRHRR